MNSFTIGKPMASQNFTGDLLVNNKNLTLDYVESRFVGRDEVTSQCQVSINTFQNWLRYLPARDFEFKVVKGGKKLYKIDYIQNLFEKYGDIESFKKLSQPIASDQSSDKFLTSQLIESKNETISELKKHVELLATQLETKDELLVNQLETIKELTQAVKQG